jgi:hypothetical protein
VEQLPVKTAMTLLSELSDVSKLTCRSAPGV